MENINKKSRYLIIGLVIIIAAYQTVMNYKPMKHSDRFKTYVEADKQVLNAADSLKIKKFYAKLCAVHQRVSDQKITSSFSTIDPSVIPKSFQAHICTKQFLENICTQESPKISAQELDILNSIDVYLGIESFSRNIRQKVWSGSVISEIKIFQKDRYLMLIDLKTIQLPKFREKTEQFEMGNCKGEVLVVDMHTNDIMAAMSFYAQNDESMKSIPLVKKAMDEKLRENLKKNIEIELNKCSVSIFGKTVRTKAYEIYN